MSKYSLAKEVIEALTQRASEAGVDVVDAQEALLISLVQSLKDSEGADYARGVLSYELDSLGSGGVHEIQRR